MIPLQQTILKKLQVSLNEQNGVDYCLSIGDETQISLALNTFIGNPIQIHFTQRRFCIACQSRVSKLYQQGYCYLCTQRLASCDLCIVKPERCHFHLGTCREPDWATQHCFKPHIIYLANTSGLKVGITRETQIPIRWIDQGAVSAIPIFRVKSRYHAGLVEAALASQVSDKTDWRKMLKGEIETIDLIEKRAIFSAKHLLENFLPPDLSATIHLESLDANMPIQIHYPVLEYPKKVISLNLEKTPNIEGTLLGIKGQYLILDSGVLNIRNHSGYEVNIG